MHQCPRRFSASSLASDLGSSEPAPRSRQRATSTGSGAEVVNLRAGPTDASNIRGKVDQGDEVIEPTRRATGSRARVPDRRENGSTAACSVAAAPCRADAPGATAMPDPATVGRFRLARCRNGDLGYRMVEDAAPVAEGVLQVWPTAAWLRSGGRDAHIMGALAFYELWKKLPGRGSTRNSGHARRTGQRVHPDRRRRLGPRPGRSPPRMAR